MCHHQHASGCPLLYFMSHRRAGLHTHNGNSCDLGYILKHRWPIPIAMSVVCCLLPRCALWSNSTRSCTLAILDRMTCIHKLLCYLCIAAENSPLPIRTVFRQNAAKRRSGVLPHYHRVNRLASLSSSFVTK